MANFKDCNHFATHNDYYTPYSAWEQINSYIPNGVIFECFLLNSNEQSKKHLQKLGHTVVGDRTIDFLESDLPDFDAIVSNIPFERIKSYKERKTNLKYRCLEKLFILDKPFIILMNNLNMFQKWFKEIISGKDIKFIFPTKKIEYDKYDNGVKCDKGKGCSFNSIYVTYKVLDKNIWL